MTSPAVIFFLMLLGNSIIKSPFSVTSIALPLTNTPFEFISTFLPSVSICEDHSFVRNS